MLAAKSTSCSLLMQRGLISCFTKEREVVYVDLKRNFSYKKMSSQLSSSATETPLTRWPHSPCFSCSAWKSLVCLNISTRESLTATMLSTDHTPTSRISSFSKGMKCIQTVPARSSARSGCSLRHIVSTQPGQLFLVI